MNVSAFIFDMDGVLIDSEPLWERTDAELVQMFHGHGDIQSVKTQMMGVREREAVGILQKELGLRGTVDEVVAARRRLLLEIYEKELVPRLGLKDLLQQLRGAHIKTAVASSTGTEVILWVLEKIQVRTLIDHVVSGVDVPNGKPAPDVFLKAAEILDVDPSRCVVIEDAPKGVAAAKAAGMYCIGVLHSRNTREMLKNADEVVAELSEISAGQLMV